MFCRERAAANRNRRKLIEWFVPISCDVGIVTVETLSNGRQTTASAAAQREYLTALFPLSTLAKQTTEMASAASWEGPTAAELKAAGAEAIPGGVRVKGWVIQSHKGPILNAASLQRYDPPRLKP